MEEMEGKRGNGKDGRGWERERERDWSVGDRREMEEMRETDIEVEEMGGKERDRKGSTTSGREEPLPSHPPPSHPISPANEVIRKL